MGTNGKGTKGSVGDRKKRSRNRNQLSLFTVSAQDWKKDLPLLDIPRSLSAFVRDYCYSTFPTQDLSKFIESRSNYSQGYNVLAFPEHVAAGKNTYVYDAHTYHTKVPPEAIVPLIEHYTRPGDLVLDPFCGSGMTGVAAHRAGRVPILSDISPAATFIALNFLTPMDWGTYMAAVCSILDYTHSEQMRLYGTHCRTCGALVPMEYMVWSYGLICDGCQNEFILWDVARDERPSVRESKIKGTFDCPHCDKGLQKRFLSRTKCYPVQIGYRCCESGLQESKAVPDAYDKMVIKSAERAGVSLDLWYPTTAFRDGVNTRQAIGHGLSSVDRLYTPRNLQAVARLWDIARRWKDQDVSAKLMFTVTSLYQRVTRLSEFRFWGGSGNIANYNVPMIFNEQNVFKVFYRKAKTIRDYLATCSQVRNSPFFISTQTTTDLRVIPDNSIDYIFTDPPFGANINYSEMNYLWEAWLQTFTNTQNEAIINRALGKTLDTYKELMLQALLQIHRVLKPGRWLTLVFHNSSAKVWSALQDSLSAGGFRVDATHMLDKKHGTFKQFVSENAVGYDLMLHCKKDGRRTSHVNVRNATAMDMPAIEEDSVRILLERTLKKNPKEFLLRYLHVKRDSELDMRKLYSLWIKERMELGEGAMDYEKFRSLVN